MHLFVAGICLTYLSLHFDNRDYYFKGFPIPSFQCQKKLKIDNGDIIRTFLLIHYSSPHMTIYNV